MGVDCYPVGDTMWAVIHSEWVCGHVLSANSIWIYQIWRKAESVEIPKMLGSKFEVYSRQEWYAK